MVLCIMTLIFYMVMLSLTTAADGCGLGSIGDHQWEGGVCRHITMHYTNDLFGSSTNGSCFGVFWVPTVLNGYGVNDALN